MDMEIMSLSALLRHLGRAHGRTSCNDALLQSPIYAFVLPMIDGITDNSRGFGFYFELFHRVKRQLKNAVLG